MYRDGIVGPAPAFPNQMEQRITDYLHRDPAPAVATARSVVQPSPLLGNVPSAAKPMAQGHGACSGPSPRRRLHPRPDNPVATPGATDAISGRSVGTAFHTRFFACSFLDR